MDELNKYSRSNPFSVPEDYFENFDKKLNQRIKEQKEDNDSIWKLNSIKPFLAIAASFLLLFSLWFFILNKIETKSVASNEQRDDEDIILRYFESVSSDELIYINE